MKLRVGYELQYEFPQPTPLIAMLNIHFSRVGDLAAPDHIVISPSVPISCYRDGFGNWCSRSAVTRPYWTMSMGGRGRPSGSVRESNRASPGA